LISAELLDSYLELWARGKLADGACYKALSYPASTSVHRYARRGGAAPHPTVVSPVGEATDAFETVDRAVAQMRQSHNPLWYCVLTERLLGLGPDEARAKRLRISPDRFKTALNSARRWLREQLDR
jgi:hypothetical protein